MGPSDDALCPCRLGGRVVLLSKDDARLLLDILADLRVRQSALAEVERIAGRRVKASSAMSAHGGKIAAYVRSMRMKPALDETA